MDTLLPLDVNAAPALGGLEPTGARGRGLNPTTLRPTRDRSERAFELTVFDEPIPWKRPEEHRYVVAGVVRVKRYEHDDVRQAKARIAWAARARLPQGWRPLDGALAVKVIAYVTPPDYVLRSKTPELCLPAVRPDADNLGKMVLDALNGVVWSDDSRAVDCTVRKRYALDGEPRWRIIVDRIWREYAEDQPEALSLPLPS